MNHKHYLAKNIPVSLLFFLNSIYIKLYKLFFPYRCSIQLCSNFSTSSVDGCFAKKYVRIVVWNDIREKCLQIVTLWCQWLSGTFNDEKLLHYAVRYVITDKSQTTYVFIQIIEPFLQFIDFYKYVFLFKLIVYLTDWIMHRSLMMHGL